LGPPIRIAANALIIRDAQVLLVELKDETGLRYNFPGGGVEAGETLEEAVRREIMEETCLEATVERLVLIVESVAARNTNLVGGSRVPWNELRFFFLCHPVPGSEPGQPDIPDNDHQTGVRWVDTDSLDSLVVFPRVWRELLVAIDSPVPLPAIVPNPHA
jgi:ADP-ribose pyrophosphatase YjhB (NUDIX family)